MSTVRPTQCLASLYTVLPGGDPNNSRRSELRRGLPGLRCSWMSGVTDEPLHAGIGSKVAITGYITNTNAACPTDLTALVRTCRPLPLNSPSLPLRGVVMVSVCVAVRGVCQVET
ncbi:hypothetical protein E2C01_070710 [Portunus trituberculatus]|uniref:Uncharacterized protein n=1 Tax=Portunus trituberculatus TaxID=210409 RepID=A0A5B7HUW7_PORTR|nr:hypothetical protein [Portunus trituberculatus]